MAKKTRTELSTLAINTNLPDNTTELITPTTERAQLTDERESVVNYKDDLGGVPNAGKFLTVAVDGESLTMVDEPQGDIQGSGVDGQITYWDGTKTVTSDAMLLIDTTNKTLRIVIPAANSGGGISLNAVSASASSSLNFLNNGVTYAQLYYDNSTANLRLVSGGDVEINPSGTLSVDSGATFGGDVGIGTGSTTPSEKLDVYGNIKIGTTANSNFLNRSDSHWIQYNGGATTNDTYMRVYGVSHASAAKTIGFYTNNSPRLTISSGGAATLTKTGSGVNDANLSIINSDAAGHEASIYFNTQHSATDYGWKCGMNIATTTFAIGTINSSGIMSDKLAITSGGDLKVTSGSFYNSVSGVTKIGNVGDYEFLDSLGSGTRRFRPATDDAIDIGDATHRFDDIFATNGTINTSDKNQKNTILESDLGLDFINRLKPKSYKWNSKTRTHYGLISQDIESVLSDISKETKDFAGFIKSPKDIDDKNNTEFVYGLRYNEFISPMIKAIQEQQTIIEDLKARIEILEL